MKSRPQLYLLLGIVLFSVIGTAMPYPIIAPLLLSHSNPSLSTEHAKLLLGLTLAAYPLGEVLGSAIIGRLADQYGRKKILLYTLNGSIIGYAFSGLAINLNNYYLLILMRFVTGAFEGNFSIAQALIIDITNNKRKDLGLLSAIASSGWLIGPLMGGCLTMHVFIPYFGYALPFYFAGGIALILLRLTKLYLKENYQVKNIERKKLIHEVNFIKNFIRLIKDQHVKWCLISNCLLTVAMTTYYEFYPVILVKTWGMGSEQIAFWTALLSLSIAFGSLYLSRMILKITPSFFVVIILICIMIPGYFFLISGIKYFVYISFMMLGLFYGAAFNLLIVILSDVAHDQQQAETLGFRLSLTKLGTSIMCILGGFLIMYSVCLPIIFAIGFCLLNLGCLLYMNFKFQGQYTGSCAVNPSQ